LTRPAGILAKLAVPAGAGTTGLTTTLWAINLASISASVLVYVFLAHYAYREINSLLLSEFVLFAPMVMPVVLGFQLNQVASRASARTLLLGANLIGGAVCAVLFLALPLNQWTVLAGAGIVGTLDAVQRIARIVAIKRYFSPEEVRFTVPLTLTAQFIAGAMAGAIIAFFPGQMTTEVVAATTIGLLGIAAGGALLLPGMRPEAGHQQATAASIAKCLAMLRSNPALRNALIDFVILGGFFQGFYNISRVALPAHHLGLGQTYVGLLQIVASLSAVIGALSFYFLSRKKVKPRLGYVTAACAVAMLLSCFLRRPAASFASYFVFFFFFEIAFFRLQGDIMAATPSRDMPVVATVQYAMVYAAMMLAIAVGAFLVNAFGLTTTALLFVVGFYAVSAVHLHLSSGGPRSDQATS
jgi:hypothetical protein